MTNEELITRALRELTPAPTQEEALRLRSALETHVKDALQVMAHRVAEQDNYRGLQKDFSATPVAGVVDTTALTGIVFNLARSEVRISSSNLPLTPIADVKTLANADLELDQVYYSQDGTDIRFLDTAGSLTSYATAVKIRANYIPALSEVPSQYEPMLVSTLAGLIGQPRSELRSQELSMTGRA